MTTSPLPLPVGFRFRTTEEELIDHYLKNKINGQYNFDDVIRDIDICSFEPSDLPALSLMKSDNQEWFYFSRVDYKSNGNSRNRATKTGFWKITGKERVIKARRSKALIGKKRTLTFYKGKVRSGVKTGWVIHEYYIPEALFPKAVRQRDFVLCRLKEKDEGTENGVCDEGQVFQTSMNDVSDFQNLMADLGGPSITEDSQITLQKTRPEEIIAALFSNGSPQSPDNFANMRRGSSLLANAGNDDQSISTLLKEIDEGLHQQGLSIQDTNALSLNQCWQRQTSFEDVASNFPPNIGDKPTYILQGDDGSSNGTWQKKGEILNYGRWRLSGLASCSPAAYLMGGLVLSMFVAWGFSCGKW